MGDAYWHLGKYDSSINKYRSALNIYTNQKNIRLKADILASIGYVLMEKGDLTAAHSHLLEAHQFAVATKSQEQSIAVTSYLAILYERMGNWNKALEMHRQTALHYLSTNNKYNLAQVYSNIGQSHFNLNNNDSAKFYFNEAIKIFSGLGEKKGIANIYLNLSEIEKYEQDYVASLKHLELARKNYEVIGDAGGFAMSLYQSGDLHFVLKDYASAKKDFEKSYSHMRESGNTYRLKATLRKLGQCCFHLNDLLNAWKYQEEYIKINDSLYSVETAKTISELGEKYESRLRTTEIENLKQSRIADQKEIEKQNLQKILFAVGLACVLVLALVFYRNYRSSQKQKKLIEDQKNLVEEKQKEILDSIHYARRIQRSLLASESYIRRSLSRLNGSGKK